MSKNKVKFGLNNVHIAVITEENGEITYGTPFAMPGAVSLTADAEGDINKFYADNIVYYISTANNGYSGKLELAMAPDEFFTTILGQTQDTNGAIIESSDDVSVNFALMGEIEGDKKHRRFVYYYCKATRPSNESNTDEDSIEVQTDSIDIEMAPRSTDSRIKAILELSDDNTDVYESFFDEVYEQNKTVESV